MSKHFFGSFEHGKIGGFVINEDLYINTPDYWDFDEDKSLVFVGLRHEYSRRFCDVPNIETGEEICKWILFELLPMYNEWKQSRYTRTPWEMKNKTTIEEEIYSLVFPYYPFPDINSMLHLRVINGKIMTMMGDKVIEELPKRIKAKWELDRYLESFIENKYSTKAIKCCQCGELYPPEQMKVFKREKKREWTNFQDKPYYSHYHKRFITLYPELPKAPRKDMTGGFIYKEVEEYICPQCLEEEQTQWEECNDKLDMIY